jgi:hypothetical protein
MEWLPAGAHRSTPRILRRDDGEELSDSLGAGESVGQRQIAMDRVMVSTAVARAGDVAGRGELVDDPMRRSLGDSDAVGDLAQAYAGVFRDAQQHLGVVREKRPRWSLVRHYSRITFLELNFSIVILEPEQEGSDAPLQVRCVQDSPSGLGKPDRAGDRSLLRVRFPHGARD